MGFECRLLQVGCPNPQVSHKATNVFLFFCFCNKLCCSTPRYLAQVRRVGARSKCQYRHFATNTWYYSLLRQLWNEMGVLILTSKVEHQGGELTEFSRSRLAAMMVFRSSDLHLNDLLTTSSFAFSDKEIMHSGKHNVPLLQMRVYPEKL